MDVPLMPKATAIWLVENTSLTFEQIAEFCHLHILEVRSIADGEFDTKMAGFDPIVSSQLTMDEIKRCETDTSAVLQLKRCAYLDDVKVARSRYTPKSKRQDKPDAIAWLVKYYPEMPDGDVCELLGTTKITLRAVKNKTHKNSVNIKPKSPVSIGLCSQSELDFYVAKINRK